MNCALVGSVSIAIVVAYAIGKERLSESACRSRSELKPNAYGIWWALRDLNPRPSPCKGDALAN